MGLADRVFEDQSLGEVDILVFQIWLVATIGISMRQYLHSSFEARYSTFLKQSIAWLKYQAKDG